MAEESFSCQGIRVVTKPTYFNLVEWQTNKLHPDNICCFGKTLHCKSGADIGIGRENPVVQADALSELVNSKSRIDMNAFSKIIFIIFSSSFQRDVEDENKLPLLKAHSVQVLNLFFYFVTWLH